MTQRPVTTVAEILAGGATIDLPTAGAAFGMGRTKSYELARIGEFPCRVIKVGRAQYRVTRHELLAALGLDLAGNPLQPAEQVAHAG